MSGARTTVEILQLAHGTMEESGWTGGACAGGQVKGFTSPAHPPILPQILPNFSLEASLKEGVGSTEAEGVS